jgi:hypothetical protein
MMRRIFSLKRRSAREVGHPGVTGAYWVVEDQFGRRGSGLFTDRGLAEDALDRIQDEEDRRVRYRRRPCLVCGTEFLSEGAHNRLCACCRATRLDFQMAG